MARATAVRSCSLAPWRCVILAIDPGKRGGIAIFRGGTLVAYGDGAKNATEIARAYADDDRLPLVVAIEDWTTWGKWSYAAKMGLAESVGEWKARVNAMPRRRPTTKIVRIKLDAWRKAIYGFCRAKSGFDWKEQAIYSANMRHNVRVSDHNIAEAILLGEYACRCPEVGRLAGVLPWEREG